MWTIRFTILFNLPKKNKGIPSDLPQKLLKEFAAELTSPISKIFRAILKTNKWPDDWSIEHGLALKKKQVPETEADLRIISLTSFWSKSLETFIIEWLDKEIGTKLDFSQYGGLKGQSTSHYLIELINFIHFNQDLSNPIATLAIMYDFSKAFNRQDHNTLITILSDMATPAWLLKIVMSFLTDRKILLKYKGVISDLENLPGGGPQGTKLGLYLFLILINFAGFDSNELCQNLGETVTNPKRKKIPKSQQKFIDDMTQCVAIDLKKVAIPDPNPNPELPRQFHQRTGHVLPKALNPIQEQVDKLKLYADKHLMKINEEKTKLMLFNSAKKIDVLPEVLISEDNFIEVVDEMKPLGIRIRSDLRWNSNTNALVAKGYKRLWMLRNLKRYGANDHQLFEVYIQQVRSILEQNCPVWNSGLTQHEDRIIERVQRAAVAIIRKDQFSSYHEALSKLSLETLALRREKLCLRFATKAYKHPKFKSWFSMNKRTVKTRTVLPPLKVIRTRTKHYKKSPLPDQHIEQISHIKSFLQM